MTTFAKAGQAARRTLEAMAKRFFLSACCRFPDAPAVPPTPATVRRILIPGYMGLGDFVFFVPTLRALRARFSKAEITMLWDDDCAAVRQWAELTGCVDRWLRYPYGQGDLVAWWRMNTAIRRGDYDIFLARQSVNSFVFARGIATIPYRLGHIKPGRPLDARLLNGGIPSGSKRRIPQNLEMLRPLGLDPETLPWDFRVRLPAKFHAEARAFLEAREVPADKDLVALHTGCLAQQAWKRWGIERFLRLANDLRQAHPELGILLLGGAAEQEDAAVFMRQCPDAINAVSRTSLGTTTALLERCAALVAADSGLAKVAYAQGTPTVALYGPTDPDIVSHGGTEIALRSPRFCAPCFENADLRAPLNAENCVTNPSEIRACMAEWEPERIAGLVVRVLEKRTSACEDEMTQQAHRPHTGAKRNLS